MIRMNELFDSPVPYSDMKKPFNDSMNWYFEIDGNQYSAVMLEINATYNSIYQGKIADMISNHIGEPIEKEWLRGLNNGGEYLFSLEEENANPKYDLSDTGNQSFVFSTVIEILREEVVRGLKFGYFIFRGDDESHQKLYSHVPKMLPRLISEIEYVGQVKQPEGISHLFVVPDNIE